MVTPLVENNPVSPPIEEAKRRSRWASSPPAVSAAPPLGVDKPRRPAASPDSPTSPAGRAEKGVDEAPTSQATARPRIQGPLAVKSKAAKPAEYPHRRVTEQGMIDAIQSRLSTQLPSDTGLLSIAAAKSAATAAANPQMPVADANPEAHASSKEEAPAIEIFLADADDQSGPVDADIAHSAEQRAMHSLLRYQTQAVKHSAHTSTNSGNATTMLPPVVPPVSLYANLPQEWPLARLSVQVRHISVLLRVTLFRRVAELNFRGVDFGALPREVMRNIVYDFNNIGGDLARRLASLFAFLKPDPTAGTQADTLGLALYADPAYWLYGLLSYCAKAWESKIEEAKGVPVWKAKEEGGTPDIEATGKTLALMQTVVMSFGRNQSLGKPDLPIHHIHVYFPVQFVRKLVARTHED